VAQRTFHKLYTLPISGPICLWHGVQASPVSINCRHRVCLSTLLPIYRGGMGSHGTSFSCHYIIVGNRDSLVSIATSWTTEESRCLRNVHESLPRKMSSSLSGSIIPAFRQSLPSRCLAMDAWLRLRYCSFQTSCYIMMGRM
jgi:hypothetical protein